MFNEEVLKVQHPLGQNFSLSLCTFNEIYDLLFWPNLANRCSIFAPLLFFRGVLASPKKAHNAMDKKSHSHKSMRYKSSSLGFAELHIL